MAQKDLIPMSERTKEEQKKIATMGGKASGKTRRRNATMRKTLEMLLKQKNNQGKTYRELSTLGLIKGAIQGKADNYKTMLALLGELQEESSSKDTPNININIVDNSNLEKIMYDEKDKL